MAVVVLLGRSTGSRLLDRFLSSWRASCDQRFAACNFNEMMSDVFASQRGRGGKSLIIAIGT